MNGKEDSGQKATRQRTRPAHLDGFETDLERIDEACKPDNKQKGGPGREIFKDDIYECIHRIFKGDSIGDVTNYIQGIIGAGKKIRTVLNKMDDPDRECGKAKTRAEELAKELAERGEGTSDANIINYKGRGVRIDKADGNKHNINDNEAMHTALSEFPIIKKYTGTERTSFFNKHYENLPSGDINQPGRTSELMLIDEYKKYEPSNIVINDDTNTPYGIKSFELNVNPTHYGYCGDCWLCNEPVYYYHGKLETTSCGDCEHVAGIVAGMLTGLLAYQKGPLMGYGYQPSHVHCNRFKNDDITIMFENGEWTPDTVSINKIVEYIANDDAVYSSEYCPMLKTRFKEAINPETRRTIYDKFQNDEQYIDDVVSKYKKKCTTSITKHSQLLCKAINDRYDLLNNTGKSEMQQTSEWVNTIASFFKHNPPPKQTASSGKMSGGMDGDGPNKMDGDGPNKRKKENSSVVSPPRDSKSPKITNTPADNKVSSSSLHYRQYSGVLFPADQAAAAERAAAERAAAEQAAAERAAAEQAAA